MQFISSIEELRQVYGQAGERSLQKELPLLDAHARRFLDRSPFVLIGSSDGDGNGDVTPKGDKPGFVAVLDERTIAIPDRPGNNRLDTWQNVVVNPTVGLIFLIPGMDETLRINGEARITTDEALRSRFEIDGRRPVSVLVVKVKAVYMHCAKAFMRSKLWHPESWPDRSDMPTLGQILRDQIAMTESGEEIDAALSVGYAKSMW